MIFIIEAECFRCGQPLKIYPGIEDGPGATGDLYLKISPAALVGAAQCKNIVTCDAWLAGHGPPA